MLKAEWFLLLPEDNGGFFKPDIRKIGLVKNGPGAVEFAPAG